MGCSSNEKKEYPKDVKPVVFQQNFKHEAANIINRELPLQKKGFSIIDSYRHKSESMQQEMAAELLKGHLSASISVVKDQLAESAYSSCFQSSLVEIKQPLWEEKLQFINTATFEACVKETALSSKIDSVFYNLLKGKQFQSINKEKLTYRDFLKI